MNCTQAQGLISSNLDGELTPAEQPGLSAHLQACPECRLLEASLRGQRQLFAREARLAAPVGFRTRVVANLASVPARGFAWLRLWAGVAEVAVLGLIILAGIVSGGILAGRLNPESAVASALALDLFDSAPPDSLGGAYLAMLEVDHER